MPHKCPQCQEIVKDESDHIFSGCPECGGQKWEYIEQTQETPDAREGVDDIVETAAFTPSKTENYDASKVTDREKVKQELSSQYDSVSVKRSGKYEINLTEMFNSEQTVVEVSESGTYEVKNP